MKSSLASSARVSSSTSSARVSRPRRNGRPKVSSSFALAIQPFGTVLSLPARFHPRCRLPDPKARPRVSRSLSLAILLSLPVLFTPGCRVPDPPVIKDKSIGLIYDTAMEEEIRSGKAPAILTTAYEQYIDTLAEPVAVTAWNETTCRWEVFVATNRDRLNPNEEADDDNRVLDQVRFGRALVELPRKPRGEDPRLATKRKPRSILPIGKRSSETDETTTVESHSLDQDLFLDGINDQLGRSRQRDLLVFVHGFNVNFDSAVARTAQIALDMPFNGAVVAYCWPSQGGVFNYEDDEPINKASVRPFTEFLTVLRAGVAPETRISIIVHSMGNRIVMEALDNLARESPGDGSASRPFTNVVLCAPDVGLSDFQRWAPGVVSQAERVTLYANSSDSALIASKSLHAEPRAGDAWHEPTAHGMETIDCSRIDFTFMGHSYYGSNTDVLSDLFMLIKENRPASRRPHLTRQTSETGAVYQFSKSAPMMYWTWHFDE